MTDKAGVDVALPNGGRRTSLPSQFRDTRILESTGGRDQAMLSVYESYKVIYFQAVDEVFVELEHCFGEPRPILQSIAALYPKSPSFLDSKAILLFAEACNLVTDALRNQLENAGVMLKQKNAEIVEASLRALEENLSRSNETI